VRKRIAHLEHDRLSEIFGSGLRLTEGLTGMAVLNFIKRQGLFGSKGNRSGGVGGAAGQKSATLVENSERSRSGRQKHQSSPSPILPLQRHEHQECGGKIQTTVLPLPDADAASPSHANAVDAAANDRATSASGPIKLLERKNSSVEGIVYGVAGGASYDVVMKRRQPSGRRRVALFGGSFDPMTTAHLKMVAEIIHTAAADEVWIVPCGKRPDKPSIVSRLHRYTMCQLAVVTTFSSEFPVYVRDDDIHHCAEGEVGDTDGDAMDTPALIELMKHKYPNAEFSFVIGSNLIKDLPLWHYTKESHKKWWLETPLIVMPRLGYPVPADVTRRADVTIVGNSDLPAEGSGLVTSDAESSVLRARLKEQKQLGKDSRDDKLWCIQGLVPHAVNSYIMRYNVFA
jgi:nicotinate (nicotinamide) nucleotide adenylyltransferase